MTEARQTLKKMIAEIAAEEESSISNHPDVVELADYLDEMLTPEKSDELRDHLSICSSCRDELLYLRDSENNRASLKPMTSEERAVAWARFQKSLGGSGLLGHATEKFYRRLSFAYSLAAVLLVALALSWLQKVPDGKGVTPNPAINFLMPETDPTGPRGDPGREIILAEKATALVLTLNLVNLEEFPAYYLDITGEPFGDVPFRVKNLKRQEGGHFSLIIPAAKLAPGSYRLSLFGVGEKDTQLLAGYSMRIRRP